MRHHEDEVHGIPFESWLERARVERGLPVPSRARLGEPVAAFVDYGRLMVQCETCRFAVVASRDRTARFVCICEDAKWREVELDDLIYHLPQDDLTGQLLGVENVIC